MATVRDITNMCKSGQLQEAYDLAKADMETDPTNVWTQREVGWALYYRIKEDTEKAVFESILLHLKELQSLSELKVPDDNMIFENVLFKIAEYIRNHISINDISSSSKLSSLFSILRHFEFDGSKGYSYLLQCFIKFDNWPEMADFIDWWKLDKLTQEDFLPFKLENRRVIMSLAERAFIAKSKALLRLNDHGRIEEFLPLMDELMEKHPEMTYPGYFYGKLLLALGSTPEEALKVTIPFARKKASEFWVWQLLSDIFAYEPEKQLACLIRAVNCGAKENYLGKVRIKLAELYIQRQQLEYAKFQIDKVTKLYLSEGYNLPYKIDCWIHQPWINSVISNGNSPIDYMNITNDILCKGAEEAIAVIVNFNPQTCKSILIYGYEKSISHKLRFKAAVGSILKIKYIKEADNKVRILSAEPSRFPTNLDYAKVVEGKVSKRDDKDFAFLKSDNGDFFINPQMVKKYRLQNDEYVKGLAVYNFNSKKESWAWTCLSINKQSKK